MIASTSESPVDEGALVLADEAATARLGAALGAILKRGDVVLLRGDLGAGKTAVVRAAIAERLQAPEDIPSPTFTIVQNYEADEPIWHADLYRLSDPDELIEIGLVDAFGEAIVFVEWPDRLFDLTPDRRMELTLEYREMGLDGRIVRWRVYGADWSHVSSAMHGVLAEEAS